MKSCSSSIWNDMDYHLKVIALTTIPESARKFNDMDQSYELSLESKRQLDGLSKELCNHTRNNAKPSSLIFASCYSMYSDITNLLRANGVLAIMNISKDKGDVTEGRAFHLDTQQKKIIGLLSRNVSL